MMAAVDELPAPSSLMSSRWSHDNLITCHPAQLYCGRVVERIDDQALELLIRELESRRGPIDVGPGRMGVLTWDITCSDNDGPFVLQVPLVLDEGGKRGRAKRDVPGRNVENMRTYVAQGLGRFVVEPKDLVVLAGDVPAALFAALPAEYHPLSFGGGSLHVELAEGARSWLISLGPAATAELLAEMIAVLVYHYDPNSDGGTALTDVFVNDGDFSVRRRPDGGFELRLSAARRREVGIGPNLLILYLIQMMAYEDWLVDGNLTGLPTLMSNPSVAFEGVVRGLRYRAADLGGSAGEGTRQGLAWIGDFGRSPQGRAYRPWVDAFLAGRLPLAFGGDPRERWWRLEPLRTKLGVLELRRRLDPASREGTAARAVETFVERLSREIGRVPADDPGTVRVNDLDLPAIERLLDEASVPDDVRARIAADVLARWPYRSFDHLLAQVPGARALRRFKSRLSFGRVLADHEQGTLAGLGPAKDATAPTRPLANPEMFGVLPLAPAAHAAAVRTFPTFEAYMDAALHDPTWGYYPHHVSIGRGGHFITHPESFSPRYGRWIARWAFRLWHEMIARGDLTEAAPFTIIEFGAGNGRLARDVLDAIAQESDARRRTFADRVSYRIYETSVSLREKQSALLGARAVVMAGDARRPAETLARDFPDGFRGLVLTNEVPDAFGVHKVVLAADGHASAALVVPRVEVALRDAVGADLSSRIADVDRAVRAEFGWRANPGDCYLDAGTWAAVMRALAALPAETRDPLLASALWFEEAYVPASALPALAAHLAGGAAQRAIALAAEDSGVIAYVNVHAAHFIREVAASLAAGFVITIDYGSTTWGLIDGARRGEFPFRVYGGGQEDFLPRPNDPYSFPGLQDMTADVDFTDLARTGRDAGLQVIHFGPERDLVGDELPDALVTAAGDEAMAKFLGNPVFMVLILGTRGTDVFAGPLSTTLPLERRGRRVTTSVPRS